MKTTARARNNARIYAVQAIYQMKIAGNSFEELKVQYYSDNFKRHETDWNFFYLLIDALKEHNDKIKQYIDENSKNGIDLINDVDLAVLQVAISELISCLDHPYQVIIKEHVEIAYSMGTKEGYKFINALLQKLSKNIRCLE